MSTERIYTFDLDTFYRLGPDVIAMRLRSAGFKFEPGDERWRLVGPYSFRRNLTTITVRQWDEPQEKAA